jgi:hypothetical protein
MTTLTKCGEIQSSQRIRSAHLELIPLYVDREVGN